jgi:membrane-associated phospholipid phosphatase
VTPARAFLLLLPLALTLSALAATNDRLPGDLWLARSIQDLPESFESPAEWTRALTTTWAAVVIGTVLVTAFDFMARRRAWLVFTILLLVLPLLQATIKNIVDRPRPDGALIERRAAFTSESFPSGHVMSGTALFLLAAWLIAGKLPPGRPRLVTWAVCAFACGLNGVANVYEGVHWPSDVLGGYLWAAVLMTGAWALAGRREVRANKS